MADMKWIPVTERLPEKHGWYLVTIYDLRGDLMVAIASYYPALKTFTNFGDLTLDVIAWMPYPEPYNKDAPSSNDDDAAHYLLKKHSEMALKELEGAWRLFESLHKHPNN